MTPDDCPMGAAQDSDCFEYLFFQTVSLEDEFYLMYRSYENNDGLGGTGECVSIKVSKELEGPETAESIMKYWDPKTSRM